LNEITIFPPCQQWAIIYVAKELRLHKLDHVSIDW